MHTRTQLCERFSYYGIRSVLVVYLLSLGVSAGSGEAIFHAFAAVAYLSPLLGAWYHPDSCSAKRCNAACSFSHHAIA